ncbi:hypothetical protein V6N11_065928 [Hibiscus sabdariffa]|uniref:Uncharacterized protein n=1 Tax=Hibiscus sabdariffa TaxID=183260 RepID=A0ABR2PJ70_9ROSI
MILWKEKGGVDKDSWYNFIEDDLRNIFKKVVRMLFNGIDDKRCDGLYGNLAKSILISDNGDRAKFLPFSIAHSKSVDLDKFQHLIYNIIGLPFGMPQVIDNNSGFNLPYELSHFLFHLDNNF